MITTNAQGLFTPRANLRCETVQDEDYATRVAQQIILAGFLVIVELGLAVLAGVGLTHVGVALQRRFGETRPQVPRLVVISLCIFTAGDLLYNGVIIREIPEMPPPPGPAAAASTSPCPRSAVRRRSALPGRNG